MCVCVGACMCTCMCACMHVCVQVHNYALVMLMCLRSCVYMHMLNNPLTHGRHGIGPFCVPVSRPAVAIPPLLLSALRLASSAGISEQHACPLLQSKNSLSFTVHLYLQLENQNTREKISAQEMSHKYNSNKDPSHL